MALRSAPARWHALAKLVESVRACAGNPTSGCSLLCTRALRRSARDPPASCGPRHRMRTPACCDTGHESRNRRPSRLRPGPSPRDLCHTSLAGGNNGALALTRRSAPTRQRQSRRTRSRGFGWAPGSPRAVPEASSSRCSISGRGLARQPRGPYFRRAGRDPSRSAGLVRWPTGGGTAPVGSWWRPNSQQPRPTQDNHSDADYARKPRDPVTCGSDG
jgi:hypothetical protein